MSLININGDFSTYVGGYTVENDVSLGQSPEKVYRGVELIGLGYVPYVERMKPPEIF